MNPATMFGHQGAGVWPSLSGSSGGPPGPPNGSPFGSIYSGLVPPTSSTGLPQQPPAVASAGSHHGIGHQFVHPHFPIQPQQEHHQQPMQRQLGQSHLMRGGPSASGGGLLMLPPGGGGMPTSRSAVLLKERDKQAEKRRKAEEERQQVAKANQEFYTSSGLFERPKKISVPEHDQVAQVLGRFDNAQRIINSHSSCIGVDYAPPTPAPVQHIIGEEDEITASSTASNSSTATMMTPASALYGGHQNHHHAAASRRPPNQPSMPRPPSNQRLPENINQIYPPRPQQPSGHHNHHQPLPRRPTSMGPPMSNKDSAAASARLKDVSKTLPRLNLDNMTSNSSNISLEDIDSPSLQKIFSEMKNPLMGSNLISETSMMPPPLSAIITPRVTNHEGNNARSVPKYFVTPTVSPPPSPIKPMKASPMRDPIPSSNGHKKQSHAKVGSTLSEDSESDHEKAGPGYGGGGLNLVVNPSASSPIEQKRPPLTASISANNKHTTSESSECDDSSSDDSSSDEDKASRAGGIKKAEMSPTSSSALLPSCNSAAEAMDMDSTFSLNSLLNKVKKQSPGPSAMPQATTPTSNLFSAASDVNDDCDISDLLSQKRSPFPTNLTDEVTTKPILDISRPLSPIHGSPLDMLETASTTSSSRSSRHTRRRRSHKPNSSMNDSSDEDLPSVVPPVVSKRTKKSDLKRPGPMPRKTAIAQMSASQEEDESLGDDLMIQFEAGAGAVGRKRGSKKTKKPSKKSVPASNPWNNLTSSGEDEADDEDKDESYGLKKSPTKRKKMMTPTTTQPEVAKKREAITNIFRVKKTTAAASGKAGVQVVVKQVDELTPILKRLDGRPIMMCRIPFSSISSPAVASKKPRERKHSTASSTTSNSSSRNKNKNMMDVAKVKPEATTLDALPGSTSYRGSPVSTPASSLRSLMPPPTKKKEAEATDEVGIEAEDEFQVYMTQAKKLKHEADGEPERERQVKAMKYLEAVLYFILCGNTMELRGDRGAAFTMFHDVKDLVKFVTKPLRGNNSEAGTDNKLVILSLRCQSLLHLKLYKLRKHDMRECQQKLEDLLNNASKKTANSETSPVGNGLSPTPSPAGSEGSVCSKSSGYTSAGELPGPILSAARPGGVLTPPTPSSSLMGGTMSVPHTLMHKQYRYSNFLTQCHELWEMADLFTHRGHCSDFIVNLDQSCGTLTLHSSLKDLVKYTQAGLDYIAKERESLHRSRRL